MDNNEAKARRNASLATPSNLGTNATRDIAGALNILLADLSALFVKTKNFHWHVSGPHFRDYHLLLDDQADQIFAVRARSGQGGDPPYPSRCQTSGLARCNAQSEVTPPWGIRRRTRGAPRFIP
jgi:hypothetical protein